MPNIFITNRRQMVVVWIALVFCLGVICLAAYNLIYITIYQRMAMPTYYVFVLLAPVVLILLYSKHTLSSDKGH